MIFDSTHKRKSRASTSSSCLALFLFSPSLSLTHTHMGRPCLLFDPVYMPINLYDIFKRETNCPMPGLHPVGLSGASSLVACSLVCLWQPPVVRHQRYSSRCQSLNRKSHSEDLLINIDLITARQKTESVDAFSSRGPGEELSRITELSNRQNTAGWIWKMKWMRK